jgi:hypothetical protein
MLKSGRFFENQAILSLFYSYFRYLNGAMRWNGYFQISREMWQKNDGDFLGKNDVS